MSASGNPLSQERTIRHRGLRTLVVRLYFHADGPRLGTLQHAAPGTRTHEFLHRDPTPPANPLARRIARIIHEA